jgi:predicted phosphodiesterase/DNA-binding PadR family transcriptional regulator
MFELETIDAEKKLRVSFALFSFLADNGHDYIGAYGLFVLTILRNCPNSNSYNIKERLKKEFELIIPTAPLGEVLSSLLREDLIEITNHEIVDGSSIKYYTLTELGENESDKCAKEDDIKEKLETLYIDVRAFLETKSKNVKKGRNVRSTPRHTRRILLRFIDRNISPLLYYTHGKDDDQKLRSEIDEFFKKSKRKTDVQLCEYTRKAKNENSPFYPMIQQLIEGTLFSYFYNVDDKYINYKKEATKPDIYLDTNLLIFMLGYQFREFTDPAKELKELLKEWNFNLKVFSFTLMELRQVLRRCTRRGVNYSRYYLVNSICSYFNIRGISRSTIIDNIDNLENIINDMGIEIIESEIDFSKYDMSYIEALRKEFFEFRKDRRKIIKKGTVVFSDSIGAIDHDISAFLKVKEIRGDGHLESFENAKAIFLTADQGLANHNLKSHLNEHTIPEIYLDRFLMELLWVKDPRARITVESLIATCSRDIFIHPYIWEYFIKKLSEKYGNKAMIEKKLTNMVIHELNERLAQLNPNEFNKIDVIVDEYGPKLFADDVMDQYDHEDAEIEIDLEATNIMQSEEQSVDNISLEHAESKEEDNFIHILHLSDLHISNEKQAKIFQTQLERDLRANLKSKSIDYIIISGDITNKAAKEEYKAAYEMISYFITNFNIKSDHVIIVPGNHDVNYECSDKAYSFIPKHKITSTPDKRKFVRAGPGILLLTDEEIYKQRFSNFNKYLFRPLCDNKDYPIDHDQQALLIEQPDEGILILALNSCWEIDHCNEDRSGIIVNNQTYYTNDLLQESVLSNT